MTEGSKHRGPILQGFDGSEAAVDALLAEVARSGPVPSAALMSRILADAGQAMPRKPSAMPVPAVSASGSRAPGWLGRVVGALGGWGGIGGLVSATVAGVWIGFGDVGGGLGVTSLLGATGTETATTVELMPDADAFAQTGTGG